MNHSSWRRVFPLLLIAALLAVSAASGQTFEQRNLDRRTDIVTTKALPNPAQKAAASTLAEEIPELAVDFDETTGAARTVRSHMGYISGPNPGAHPEDLAIEFARQISDVLGLTDKDLRHYEVTDVVHSELTGSTHVYLRQTSRGLAVYNGQLQVNINRDGRVMSVNNAFVPDLDTKTRGNRRPSLNASQAVRKAAEHLGLDLAGDPQTLSSVANERQSARVAGQGISQADIDVELFWLPVGGTEVRTMWNLQIETLDGHHYFDMNVDAESGEVWTRFDWTNSGSYRVFADPDESPLHGSQSRTLVVNPEDAVASPNGWFTGGTMSGNNVTACPDANGNNGCDSNPQCSGTTCDFALNLTQAPSSYIPAATANLFYWNNRIHDIQYQYGFTESAGNFQENNFGKGGSGSDSVNADAQDGSGNCNANFSTPTDGGNPRMQMFTCNRATPLRDGDFDNGVIVHEYGHGISIRQVGGPGNSSCLNNSQQAGEGWSDFFGLVYTGEVGDAGTDARGIGSYLFNETPEGGTIRDLPYSTNPAVNNWTYQSISGAGIPHGVGSRWAQVAWEVYWALVDQYGFEADLENFDISDPNEAGNKRALFYVNEGLKNTACSPTFVNNRDGIIQAATDNFSGVDVCLIWEAFAAYGLGTDAVSGGSSSTNPTNGFSVPTSCSGPPPPPPPPPPTCGNELHGADFTSGAGGWTNGADTCTTGAFVVGSPDATAWQVGGGNPGNAFYTAPNPGGIGSNDVDGGTCEALSPVVSGSGDVTVSLDYFHGQRDAGDDAADGFTIEVLNNGSVAATLVNIGDVTNTAAWTNVQATIPNAGNVQIRVRATDAAGPGDIVEGGIDNVQICGDAGGPPPPPPPGGGCTEDNDFEAGDTTGWTNDAASTCSTGDYVLGTPDGVNNGGVQTQVAGASSGVNALFTAANTGGAGTDDVDGGNCILSSPTWSVANASTLSVDYFHGQRDAGDDAAGDFFRLEYSTNGGSSWSTLASTGDSTSNAAWATATAQIPAGSNVELRVQCSDGTAGGDLVECGIDDVSICDN